MALPPKVDDPFFREVDEELRRDQLMGFWKRFGIPLVALVVVGLGIFGGVLWWKHAQMQRAGVASEKFTQALYDIDQGKRDAATPTLKELADGSIPAYRAEARLMQAGALLDKGDVKGAAAAFKAIADDKDLPQPMRDAARIRQTTAEFDTLPPAAVVERLKPLAVEGNPWFGSAGELVALSYLKLKKPELAAPLFAAIAKDASATEALRSRALRMASSLGADTAAQPKSTVKE
ncbi:MAG TPA: tetratricopeptide repeat protein [Sphingomonadaceae bacterium]|nr:tetratricopeptide repeat protein [Sphingomonadaceae bacterium]